MARKCNKRLFRPRNLRRICLGFLGGMVLNFAVHLVAVVLQPASDIHGFPSILQEAIYFRGLEYFDAPIAPRDGFITVTLLLTCGALISFSLWLFQGLRNLRSLQIFPDWHPLWAISPLIFPLFWFFVPIAVLRDLLVKNHYLLRVLGPGKGKRRKRYATNLSLQHLVTAWWWSILLCRILLLWHTPIILGKAWAVEETMVNLPVTAGVAFLLFVLPLILAMWLIWEVGKLEDRTYEIVVNGELEQYRTHKLPAGQIIPDLSTGPAWYAEPGSEDLDADFQDRFPPSPPPQRA